MELKVTSVNIKYNTRRDLSEPQWLFYHIPVDGMPPSSLALLKSICQTIPLKKKR